MKKRSLAALTAFALLISAPSAGAAAQNYAGQEARDIKALSPDDVQDYLAGRGMGFAKAAELNGLPGPSHVLSLSEPLALSAEQKAATQTLFKAMEAKAIGLGRQLVDEERRLDSKFARRQIQRDELSDALLRIAVLQARIRGAHLEAHIEQTKILTPEQIALYMQLRGYAASQSNRHSEHAHH